MICFGHDAPTAITNIMDIGVFQNFWFSFHGTSPKEIDMLMQKTFSDTRFKIRGHVLYQWLVVLRRVNHHYKFLQLPTFDECQQKAEELLQHLKITAQSVIEKEEDMDAIGDDVAGVRTIDSNGIPAVYAGKEASPKVASNKDLLQSIATVVGSVRETDPYNEFEKNDELFCHTFPQIFTLGKFYHKKGSLSTKEVDHLLKQFTQIPAVSKDLIFLLVNQKNRHSNSQRLSYRVKANSKTFRRFAHNVTTPIFHDRMKEALDNPESKEAEQLIKEMMPMLKMFSNRNGMGSMSLALFETHFRAMVEYFGPATVFFTIAPDDVNNPKTFRLTQRFCNNMTFPAKVADKDEYMEALIANSHVTGTGDIPIDTKWETRKEKSCDNPVATTTEYMKLIEHVLEDLIKLKSNSDTKRTTYYLDSAPGIFGHLNGGIGVHETQARGSLHLHLILFGGLRPDLLQKYATCEQICTEISKVLDSMFCAELSKEDHVFDIVRSCLSFEERGTKKYAAYQCWKKFETLDEMFSAACEYSLEVQGVHKHCMTCHKPPRGLCFCRMVKPDALCPKTSVCQLLKKDLDEEDDLNDDPFTYSIADAIEEERIEQERKSGPFVLPDDRVLVWEIQRAEIDNIPALMNCTDSDEILRNLKTAMKLKHWNQVKSVLEHKAIDKLLEIYVAVRDQLPARNGYVVTFNKTMTAMVGSNTNALMLGNATSSKAACYYLKDYLKKDKLKVEVVLSILMDAKKRVESSWGNENDGESRSDMGKAQFFLNRVINSLDVAMELSDTQAVASLFDLNTEFVTHDFAFVGIREAMKFQDHLLHKDIDDSDASGGDNANLDTNDDSASVEGTNSVTMESVRDWGGKEYQEEFIESEFGTARRFKIYENGKNRDPTIIFIPYPDFYLHRGELLRILNRIEYNCLLRIVEKKKEKALNKGGAGAGRPTNARFSFGKGFVLEATHDQQLLSKHLLPIHTVGAPKIPNFNKPHRDEQMFRKECDDFAKYYLMAYRPELDNYDENNRTLQMDYSFEALQSFMDEMANSNRFIDQARLKMMTDKMFSLHTTQEAKVLLSQFRRRNVDYWSNDERDRCTTFWKKYEHEMGVDNDLEFMDDMDNLCMNDIADAQQVNRFSEFVTHGLTDLYDPINQNDNRSMGQLYGENSPSIPLYKPESNSQMPNLYAELEKHQLYEPFGATNGTGDQLASGVQPSTSLTDNVSKAKELIDQRQPEWKPGQKALLYELVQIMQQMVMNNKEPLDKPPVILTTGGPGTGKTTVLNEFNDIGEVMEVTNFIRATYMGVAAIQAKGTTILKLFKCELKNLLDEKPIRPISHDQLRILRGKLNLNRDTKTGILVIDEISMIGPRLLALIDTRLRAATGKEVPFGGFTVILVGDLSQISPIGSDSLAKGVMKVTKLEMNNARKSHNQHYGTSLPVLPDKAVPRMAKIFQPQTAYRRGVELFKLVKWVPLWEQVRSKDPVHTELIERMSKGEDITMEDLVQMKPLTKTDMKDKLWKYATIVTATNRERIDLCHAQAQRFALENKQILIRWPNEIVKWKGAPKTPERKKDAIDNDPAFWQFFIKLALIYILHNINSEGGVANGTLARLHSIVMADPDEDKALRRRIQRAKPGDTVTLTHPPKYVIVELYPDDAISAQKWTGPTLVPGKVVVPLQVLKVDLDDKKTLLPIRGGMERYGYLCSKARIRQHFPFELSFATTFYKVQGKTLMRIILSLCPKQVHNQLLMTYAAMFVALTRVEYRDHIRLLFKRGTDHGCLEYLTKLKPEPELKEFMAGFATRGSHWDPELAFKYCISRINS